MAIMFAKSYAGVVEEILDFEAIGRVDNKVVSSDGLLRIGRAKHLVYRLDADMGIERLQLLASGESLGSIDVGSGVEYLSLQVAEADLVTVHKDRIHGASRGTL